MIFEHSAVLNLLEQNIYEDIDESPAVTGTPAWETNLASSPH